MGGVEKIKFLESQLESLYARVDNTRIGFYSIYLLNIAKQFFTVTVSFCNKNIAKSSNAL